MGSGLVCFIVTLRILRVDLAYQRLFLSSSIPAKENHSQQFLPKLFLKDTSLLQEITPIVLIRDTKSLAWCQFRRFGERLFWYGEGLFYPQHFRNVGCLDCKRL